MPAWRRLLCVLFVGLTHGGTAPAEPPMGDTSAAPSVRLDVDVGRAPSSAPTEVWEPKTPSIDAAAFFLDIKLLLGLPTGVRVGVPLYQTSRFAFAVEGFAGLAFAGGFRAHFTVIDDGASAFLISPGVHGGEATFIKTATIVGGDVDITSVHRYSSGFASEFGLTLGATATGRGALPIVALFAGVRF